ncbi:hypothetical protein L3Q72_13150 [Vibrio sp. JC009]|uniref:hypothetical protein n=1 Tax=Vibrio sp. JC009 TaxID=2912314 RepID=UPI0023B077FD|nr:hypothetical protein [Vibrio sp. JC009]WED21560.1 hypothetical protein L3Q72_13150 [Vibrio sp. JC009]
MNTLGLRASPTEVTFCVYNAEEKQLINVEEIKIPNALEIPEKLKYVRATILDVLHEYSIDFAGIRLTETIAKSSCKMRIQIEGVLQEAFASSNLTKYYQGGLATIAAKVNEDKTQLKRLINTKAIDFEQVADWQSFNEKEREAIVTALGAIYA